MEFGNCIQTSKLFYYNYLKLYTHNFIILCALHTFMTLLILDKGITNSILIHDDRFEVMQLLCLIKFSFVVYLIIKQYIIFTKGN